MSKIQAGRAYDGLCVVLHRINGQARGFFPYRIWANGLSSATHRSGNASGVKLFYGLNYFAQLFIQLRIRTLNSSPLRALTIPSDVRVQTDSVFARLRAGRASGLFFVDSLSQHPASSPRCVRQRTDGGVSSVETTDSIEGPLPHDPSIF